jgi:hypothetical protein
MHFDQIRRAMRNPSRTPIGTDTPTAAGRRRRSELRLVPPIANRTDIPTRNMAPTAEATASLGTNLSRIPSWFRQVDRGLMIRR